MRIPVAFSVLGLALLPPAGAAQGDGGPEPVQGLQQVYQAGRLVPGGVAPSTPIPDCIGEDDPPGCYDGEKVSVQAVYIGRDAAEPTIGVDKKGNAFMSAMAYDGPSGLPRTFVVRSMDGGATWAAVDFRLPGNNTEPPLTLDPYIFVDEDTGRVFDIDLTLACSYLSFSDDQGRSWLQNPIACGQPINDHQTLVAGPPPPGIPMPIYPNMVYYCFNRVTDSSCSRSHDGGLTWIPTGSPSYLGYAPGNGDGFFGLEGFCGGLHGHAIVDSQGRIFIPRGYCDQPWLSVSEDAGVTWRRVRVNDKLSAARAHVAEHFSVATDDADNVYYLWRDEESRLPWLAISTDHGRTFREPLMVAPPGVNEVNFATIIAGEAGRIAIQFPGSTSASRDDYTRPWNSYTIVSTNALDPDPLFLSTTANPVTDPIHRGQCTGRCGLMLDYLDIVVSPADGGFWAAVVDTCTALNKCSTKKTGGASDGEGVAVRQIGGPRLRTALTLPPPG